MSKLEKKKMNSLVQKERQLLSEHEIKIQSELNLYGDVCKRFSEHFYMLLMTLTWPLVLCTELLHFDCCSLVDCAWPVALLALPPASVVKLSACRGPVSAIHNALLTLLSLSATT